MATTADLPVKSTRQMEPHELRAEALRLSIAVPDDLEDLRRVVKAELERRWRIANRGAIEGWNRWVEKNGLPLEKYRVW
ncbi:type II toxin-antitoxin system CcdA family antitoxin [Sphingomonas sp. PB2P19]|uniref:type II toxin-antitoxin system CcdA family antitoxin n=1 Tax=Sphingomonas rhamnosi TaxID=3096156 RepID=UPI002FC76BFB